MIPPIRFLLAHTRGPKATRRPYRASVPAEVSVIEPRVMLTGQPIFVDAEPGNDVAEGAFPIPESGTQLLDSRLDVDDADDWYQFSLDDEQPFIATLSNTSTPVTLVLKDSEANNIEVSRGTNERDAAIERTLPAGDYFLRVVRTTPTDTGTPTDYRLEAILEFNPNEGEPFNDTRDGATEIPAAGVQSFDSRLGLGDADDYYQFTLSDQQTVTATLTSFGSSATLVLKDADGNNLERTRAAADDATEISELLPAGTYFLRVVRTMPEQVDDAFDYRLDVDFDGDAGGDDGGDDGGGFGGELLDDEPGNDVREGAGVIPATGFQAASGTLSLDDADDYWTFNLDGQQQVVITLSGFSENLTLVLKDANGDNIEVSRNGDLDDEVIDRALPAGRYFLRVVRATPTATDLVTGYLLETNFDA